MARDENGNVTFDTEEQAKVDEIIRERISRVKPVDPVDYADLKEIATQLEEHGYFGTPAEKRAALKAHNEDIAAQAEVERLQEESKNTGTSPALLREIAEAKKAAKLANDRLEAIEAKETEKSNKKEQEKNQQEVYQVARKELLAKHEIDADDLGKNEKFMKFVRGKVITNLCEEYENFTELIGDVGIEAMKKNAQKEMRSTSAGKGSGIGSNSGLTTSQKSALEDWNTRNPTLRMSVKEYLER